jgi:hypothetical protein
MIYGTAASDAIDLWGIEGADQWTAGGLVRYRSRRDLIQQVLFFAEHSSDLQIHEFKTVALERTIAYPLDPWYQLGDPRLVLALVLLIHDLVTTPVL